MMLLDKSTEEPLIMMREGEYEALHGHSSEVNDSIDPAIYQ